MFKKIFSIKSVFSPQRTQSPTEVIFQCSPRITTQIKFKMPRGEGKYLRLSSFWKEEYPKGEVVGES
mgnify:CR=1 FL=1